MEELIELYVEKLWRVQDKDNYISDQKATLLFEQFAHELLSLPDHRLYMNLKDWTIECLWYLGDKAQLDYYNNGWENYRFIKTMDKVHKLPSKTGTYHVIIAGKTEEDPIEFEDVGWLGGEYQRFQHYDDKILYWKERTLPKDIN